MLSKNRPCVQLIALLVTCVLFYPAYADDAATDPLSGFGFGVGVSLTVDNGSNDRVASATVVDGIVRVDNEDDTLARLMLESHFFLPKKESGKTLLGALDGTRWGHGPFIAISPGEGEVIDAIGVGWMIGLRRDNDGDASDQSWNFGVGYVVDPNTQILGDGITANQPLPGNETELRFKEKTQGGWLLMASFTW